MAERPDPRKLRVISAWNGSRYPFPPSGDEPSSQPPPTPTPEGRAPAQGLYDLPALLGRIWSVPAARLATSGSYSTRPDPVPIARPEVELDRKPPEPRDASPLSPAPWSFLSYGEDSSLPLAAVPSLTLNPELRPPSGPPPFELERRPEASAFSPVTQYIAWRHPPCHLAFDPRPVRGVHCLRGSTILGIDIGLFPATHQGHHWTRREVLIRPASPAWAVQRSEYAVP
jgi:hypothetical protein